MGMAPVGVGVLEVALQTLNHGQILTKVFIRMAWHYVYPHAYFMNLMVLDIRYE